MHTASANRPTVVVLLSAYNGTTYLRPQIDSILAQQDVRVRLVVRDDGSTDGTQALLEEYAQRGQLTWFQGENVRPAQSFLHLFETASTDAGFYAFSDQDDIWQPEKLAVAVHQLSTIDPQHPALYYGQTQPVDSDLRPLPRKSLHPLCTAGESLVYHHIGGNTLVLNAALRTILVRHHPRYYPMHDVYTLAAAYAVGSCVFFDPTPHILYRQHGHNVVGQGHSAWTEWGKRLERFFQRQEIRSQIACDILRGYDTHLDPDIRQLLQRFVLGKRSLLTRLALLFDPQLRCGDTATQRLFRLSLLLNNY